MIRDSSPTDRRPPVTDPSGSRSSRMRDVFIEAVLARMRKGERVFFLSADFGSPVLDVLAKEFPDRFINVGIAEQNLVNVATGLALEGFAVVAYAIAPFLSMRCYEQTRVNLCLLSQVRPLNVTLLGVGGGLSYDVSGPTHQALEDLSIMRTLPNMEVFSPADGVAAGAVAEYALDRTGPKYVRLDGKPVPSIYAAKQNVEVAHGFHEWRSGGSVCLVATGYMTHKALAAASRLADEGRSIGVVDLFALSRFDEDALASILGRYKTVVTVEEAFVGKGGLDACMRNFIHRRNLPCALFAEGLPPRFSFTVGNRDALLQSYGLDPVSLAERVRRLS